MINPAHWPDGTTQNQFRSDVATTKAKLQVAVGANDDVPVGTATVWKADASGSCFVNCSTIKPVYDSKGINQIVVPGLGHGFQQMINSTQVGAIPLN